MSELDDLKQENARLKDERDAARAECAALHETHGLAYRERVERLVERMRQIAAVEYRNATREHIAQHARDALKEFEK